MPQLTIETVREIVQEQTALISRIDILAAAERDPVRREDLGDLAEAARSVRESITRAVQGSGY